MAGLSSAEHCLHNQGVGEILKWADRGRLQEAEASSAVQQEASATLPPEAGQDIYLRLYVDANWAGCPSTRKSTSGALILLFSRTNNFVPKTQSATAQSSAESELYTNGTGAGEALHVRTFLLETKLVSKIHVSVGMDSSSGKPAPRASDLQGRPDTVTRVTCTRKSCCRRVS